MKGSWPPIAGFTPEDPIILPDDRKVPSPKPSLEIPFDEYISSMQKSKSRKKPGSTKAKTSDDAGKTKKKLQGMSVQRQTRITKKGSVSFSWRV